MQPITMRFRNLVDSVDKTFLILFSRARRDLGGEHVKNAWQRAINKLAGYVALLAIVLVASAFLLVHLFVRAGSPPIEKGTGQGAAIVIFMIGYVILYRRYRGLSELPPALQPDESAAQTRYLFWVRVIVFGSFLMTLIIALIVGLEGS